MIQNLLLNLLGIAGLFFSLWLFRRMTAKLDKVVAFYFACLHLSKDHDIKNIYYYKATGEPFALIWFMDELPGMLRLLLTSKELTLENFVSKELIDRVYNHDLKIPDTIVIQP